jgi:uncharacterized protein DUF1579
VGTIPIGSNILENLLEKRFIGRRRLAMKGFYRIAAAMAVVLGLAVSTVAQEKEKAPNDAVIAADMEKAMTPGEAQKKLDFLVGTFDVKIRTWLDPSKPPYESTATSVATWVLGNRYVQQMLAGYIAGATWTGIGYAGYDNVSKRYVATYMDTGSTGMEWYTGTMDASGKLAKMDATIADEVTGKPRTLEMRLSIAANGDHVTELWESDLNGGKMAKIMELQYTRKKS